MELEAPEAFLYISEHRHLGEWVSSEMVPYNTDVLWLIEQGFASVGIILYDDDEWGIDLRLWSFTDKEYLSMWQLRISDYTMLNNVIEYAMDVN